MIRNLLLVDKETMKLSPIEIIFFRSFFSFARKKIRLDTRLRVFSGLMTKPNAPPRHPSPSISNTVLYVLCWCAKETERVHVTKFRLVREIISVGMLYHHCGPASNVVSSLRFSWPKELL